MPRGRKRAARSRQRVEPQTTSRETGRPIKKRRPPQSTQAGENHNDRRRSRQSPESRSPSSNSDWSSSRERTESNRRRDIAERACARPSPTEQPRRKAAPGKSKRKRNSKKPANTVDPPANAPEEQVPVSQPTKRSETNLPESESPASCPEVDQAGPSYESPDEDPSADPTIPCCIPKCPWRGADDTLPDHVESEHASLVLCGPIQQVQVPVNAPERGAALTRMVRAFGELFAVHFRRPPGANNVLGCVQLLGPPERAIDFVYQMEVRDEDGEMVDTPLQHCPLIANTSSSREFDIAESLKEVCVTEMNVEEEPSWGNREAITIEVEISTTPDYGDPDEETARSSPPPELSFMWM